MITAIAVHRLICPLIFAKCKGLILHFANFASVLASGQSDRFFKTP